MDPGQTPAFAYGPRPRASAPFWGDPERGGCIAQLVEQLTLNQRVVGSIPTAPTIVPPATEMRGNRIWIHATASK